jgi:hypothetical protein
MFHLEEYIDKSKGIFLLILALCGGYVSETLGCKVQYEMTNNRILKYLIVLFTIYFSITITSKDNENPFILFRTSILIWMFFVLFTRMTPIPTLIVMILLLLIFFLDNWKKYKIAIDKKSNILDDSQSPTYKYIIDIQKLLLVIIILLIVLGNVGYIIKKRKQYGANFDYVTYIFGVNKCKSLK